MSDGTDPRASQQTSATSTGEPTASAEPSPTPPELTGAQSDDAESPAEVSVDDSATANADDSATASAAATTTAVVAPSPEALPLHAETPQAPPPQTPARKPATRANGAWLLRGLGLAALAALAGLAVLWFVLRPAPPQAARRLEARLDLAAGDVQVQDSAGSGPALSGTPLGAGALVSTGPGARALVRTGEGAALFLRGGTKLKLAERGVELTAGELWLDAPRLDSGALEFTVGAYRITASDAGVDIRADAGGGITVYVARGLAVLTSPTGRVEIGAGEQGSASGGQKPSVKPVAFWQDWTGGMGDQRRAGLLGTGTGRLYGLDPNAPAGQPAQKLGIAKQLVHAVIRDGVAETEVDQTFSNPSGAAIEGWYWFTIPPTATVTGFALETNGQLVEGEVIERREAAAQYAAAIRQAVDPALLEWVDGRTYRARIYPIPASGTRRIVLRYLELLPNVEGKLRYVYPLRSDEPVRFDELALSVDVGRGDRDFDLATSLDARVERGGRVVSMRRSGYVPRADFQLELTPKRPRPPVAAWRFQAGSDQADYVMLRYAPTQSFVATGAVNADVVLVVDTSAGGDENSRQLRAAAAEATLRALSDQDHFAVVALDVKAKVVYPAEGLATASDQNIGKALEALANQPIGGATDLAAMFEPALERLHGKEQAALVYVGDGVATSGETGSEALVDRLRRSLTGSRSRFFAIGAGTDVRHELLTQLARVGGGSYVRVDEAGEATSKALGLAATLKTATLTDLAIDLGAGLDQPLYSATGKLARGEELVLLARTHHPLPDVVTVRGRLGGKNFEERHPLKVERDTLLSTLVPRLWASEQARRLMGAGAEENRAQLLQLGVEYALITPFTSSLALDSESAYARQGIQRRSSPLRGARLSSIRSPEHEASLLERLFPGVTLGPAGCKKFEGREAPERTESTRDGASRKADLGEAEVKPGSEPAPMSAPAPAASAAVPSEEDLKQATDAAPKPEDPMLAGAAAPTPTANENRAAVGGAKDSNPGPSPGDSFGYGGVATRSPSGRAEPAKAPVSPTTSEKQLEAALVAKPAVRRWTPPPHQTLIRVRNRCSDVASRPLPERLVLWMKRAKKAQNAAQLAALYDSAFAACELPDWRDEAALLDLIQQRVDTEQAAEVLLAHFASYAEGHRFIARKLLRRTIDVRVAAAVSRSLYGGVDWLALDRELLDTDDVNKQLARVKAAMLVAPNDPEGDVRLVRLLARTNRTEALAHGRRLRDRGLMTPSLAQQLGDVLAEAKEDEEAQRTYSELVEFDGGGTGARRVLGDIFLRHGWYAAAYRQYKTLTDLDRRDPHGFLRLASAAAGAGRIDEALRLEREVASGEGTPGPNDPRYFARLLSAARLGKLLEKPDPAAGATAEAISRKLKELSLFSGAGVLVLLTWEDRAAQLVLGNAVEKDEQLVGEAVDGGAVGIYGVLTTTESWAKSPRAVRFKSELLERAVPFQLVTLVWTGTEFKVTVRPGELKAKERQTAL